MFREFFKEQIRKTGMVRSLEIENSKLKFSLRSLKTDSEDLKRKVKILEDTAFQTREV